MFRGSLSNFEEYVSLLGLYANDFHFRDDANLRILKPDPSGVVLSQIFPLGFHSLLYTMATMFLDWESGGFRLAGGCR